MESQVRHEHATQFVESLGYEDVYYCQSCDTHFYQYAECL